MKAKITLLAYVVLISVFGFQYYSYYGAHVYDADIAKEWLWRARATNDLADMTSYLTNAEQILQGYNGNPEWLYPKPDTDYDLIRGNIQETIKTATEIEETQDLSSFAYQQAVQNLQETIVEIAEHLDLANSALQWNPFRNAPLWISGIGIIIAWIPMTVKAFMDDW